MRSCPVPPTTNRAVCASFTSSRRNHAHLKRATAGRGNDVCLGLSLHHVRCAAHSDARRPLSESGEFAPAARRPCALRPQQALRPERNWNDPSPRRRWIVPVSFRAQSLLWTEGARPSSRRGELARFAQWATCVRMRCTSDVMKGQPEAYVVPATGGGTLQVSVVAAA